MLLSMSILIFVQSSSWALLMVADLQWCNQIFSLLGSYNKTLWYLLSNRDNYFSMVICMLNDCISILYEN